MRPRTARGDITSWSMKVSEYFLPLSIPQPIYMFGQLSISLFALLITFTFFNHGNSTPGCLKMDPAWAPWCADYLGTYS